MLHNSDNFIFVGCATSSLIHNTELRNLSCIGPAVELTINLIICLPKIYLE
jgi:hypothetical protein